MLKYKFQKYKKWFILGGILLLGLIVYVTNMTRSALWYDESIEYFYSKFASGTVPGGHDTHSMYERISYTFQPPLYNWLMYVWLLFFDSESGFRLAGVLVTLLGAAGIFCSLDELTDHKWAALGTVQYIFTHAVAYYALECAEYNLMLCCVAWTLFFYIRSIKTERLYPLIGFFAAACLAVYSQYGSAFVIVVLYGALVLRYLKDKNWKMLKRMAVLSGLALIVAALPLICFFLLPQLEHQGTTEISHAPYFARGNILTDFIRSTWEQLSWNFSAREEISGIIGAAPAWFAGAAGIILIPALFRKKRDMFRNLAWICAASWLFYYITAACSLYGYNSWAPQNIGTLNIGGRYGLFFSPLWALTLTYGIYIFSAFIRKNIKESIWIGYKMLLLAAVFIFCGVGYAALCINDDKDDVREAVGKWYESNAYHSITLVHERCDSNFQFYLTHHDGYSENDQNKILTTGSWIRNADLEEMKEELDSMGVFGFKEFYFIGPAVSDSEIYHRFVEVMENAGYEIEVVYDGRSRLSYLRKNQ